MILVRLEGALGNMMFQYALGRHLAYKNKTDMKFDIDSYKTNHLGNWSLGLEVFKIKIQERLATPNEIKRFKIYQRKPGKKWFIYNHLIANGSKYVQEKHYHFDPKILDSKNNIYLHGWWQSEKYFREIRDILLDDFTFQKPMGPKNKVIADKIMSTNSVSIHMRRCDYVTDPRTKEWFVNLTKEYYDSGLKCITEKFPNPTIFVFSDDIVWVRENMVFPFDTTYIEGDNKNPHEDLHLMSLCKHQIIANSSFSWWGAWLNRNKEKIVVAPKNWFGPKAWKNNPKDLIPDSWIKM